MKAKICVGILCCIGILLSGCGTMEKNQQSTSEKSQTVIGVYGTPDYRPGAEDISAVPYEYHGEGKFFSVICKVRVMNEEEQEFQVAKKQEELGQMEQLKEEYPAREYQEMIEKITNEISVLSNAENVYVTEIFGSFIGEDQPDSKAVQYEISQGDEKYIAAGAALDAPLWVSLLNTADGSYSEGILLPCKDSYEITIQCGNIEDSFKLVRE
jgi:hypothetical protein